MAFCVWLLSLGILFLSFIHIVVYHYFIPFDGQIMFHHVYTNCNVFSLSSADGCLGHFHLLALVNRAAMNIGSQVSEYLFSFLFGITRSEIVGSYDSSEFNFLRDHQTAFHICCHNFISLILYYED